jgi:BirA family biotin operon repressor/biotin-[acetyl-CoA-carboxylase] ligase
MSIRVLDILREHNDYISGAELGIRLGISREAIWKSINRLKRYGYKIESKKGIGYRLVANSKLLLPWEIKNGLNTKFIGKEIIHKITLDSTQDLALKIAERKPEGTVIIAEEQAKGKGRFGKEWYSPQGGIWFSLILKPKTELWNITLLPLAIGVAIADSLTKLNLDVRLKWPNDLVINNKKVAGILLDVSAEEAKVNYIVIGVGINANIDDDRLLGLNATSIKMELGYEIDRVKLTQDILRSIEYRYEHFDECLNDYKARCITLNRRVNVKTLSEEFVGDAVNIDTDGSLIIVLDDNSIRRVFSSEVSLSNN